MFIKLRVSSRTLDPFWEDGADVLVNTDHVISFKEYGAGRAVVHFSNAPDMVTNHSLAEVQSLLAGDSR